MHAKDAEHVDMGQQRQAGRAWRRGEHPKTNSQDPQGGWGQSDIRVPDFPKWLPHPACWAPSELRGYEATMLQPRQHRLQAWFLSTPFLAPPCPDVVAATGAKQASTLQPL